jgi:MFS family permease
MSASRLASQLSESQHRVQLRRAVIASTIGTAIEWYDFFLYSTVTALVFAKLFFPRSDPWVGTLEAFAIYAVGFVARPVGAAIFGHYGDRIGRRSTLIATLLLMGLATFAVALVPGYQHIGIWGARCGRWRQMGWLGTIGHGMVPDRSFPGLHRLLAPVRRALRPLSRQYRRPGV